MNIYFAGSIRGGRNDFELYKSLILYLQKYGEVLTEHVGKNDVIEIESDLPEKEIHDRDMEWLKKCDLLIAEVSTASLGVGYEIGRAIELGKNVLCLYRPQPGKSLSAMIQGSDSVCLEYYTNLEQAKEIIELYISENMNCGKSQ